MCFDCVGRKFLKYKFKNKYIEKYNILKKCIEKHKYIMLCFGRRIEKENIFEKIMQIFPLKLEEGNQNSII